MSYLMKELPDTEKPREKYKQSGFAKLSDVDLIAIMLRTGTKEVSVKDLAIDILIETGGLKGLKETSLESLSKIKGIGEVKAITLLSAIELGKRVEQSLQTQKIKIENAQDVYKIFHPLLSRLTQEHFCTIFLNTKNEMIHYKTIFIGSANKSVVHPRDIFKEAIKNAAVKIMVVHNHPSGNPEPSKEDIAFTNRLIESGALLQIPLIDHIIIGSQKYYSFFDHSLK